ncbi:unnamed protein product [Ilex paraguariensis]|uniref:Uncharacterized protein n=1 Tax=Ilex paraguariensis TaxID=185542 RepID=A0ABC8SVL6_9AQUA
MSLLEVITKASANPNPTTVESSYPIILNPDPIFLNLKPLLDSSNDPSLPKRVEGFQISQTDTELIELSQKFFKKLKRKLKSLNTFTKAEFIEIFNSYLVKNSEKIGISVGVDPSDEGYTLQLIEKVGFLMGRDVLGLIMEACIVFEIWEVLEIVIVNGFVEHSYLSNLIFSLIEKKRSDLICLCVKYVSDLQTIDILHILKYFLSPPTEGYKSMVSVRKEWESQTLMAIEKVNDKSLSGKKLSLAKEASVLLMVAHDGFSVNELCLHYLFGSSNLDEVLFASCISKLNGDEMMGLIRYLGKWVRKYERFPQACPCPKASSMLGLKACNWVPTFEDIVKCFGLVVDEHFSSMVLHSEFHEELRSIEGIVNSLAAESRLCGTVANLAENLRSKVKG